MGVAEIVISRPLSRVSDRRVRRELRRAAFHAALAGRRARHVGPGSALSDRRVTRAMQRSSGHLVRAVSLSVNPPPSHRVRNTVLVVAGSAAAVVAVITLRRATRWPDDSEWGDV